MADDRKLDDDALAYHRMEPAGKLGIVATKPLATQRDLSLAYSPGVAAACRAIVDDPAAAAGVTARGNLVGVVSNGTAVLGLGAIGPLASKPVMEGKAVLFKKFAGIDVFDIEIAETDVERFCDVVAALEPTFGGINLEDIKAPECFEIEKRLKRRMQIPVFHDDQHGTAIIVAAAVSNALDLAGKRFDAARIVCAGAGAAALACLNMLVSMGAKRENIFVCDIEGVVYEGRAVLMDPYKAVYAQKTEARALGEVIGGADVFLGLSAPGVLTPAMVETMADSPIIMALANPTPEIMPEDVRDAREDAIIATGRSDYPNQVNNVLCFPYIFRGALDVGAREINEAMKVAAAEAIARLARKEVAEQVASAYGDGMELAFGRDHLIPKPFDPRLILEIAPAVAKAAMETGVAARPIEDFKAYRQRLSEFVYRSGLAMKPVFEQARRAPKRIVYCEGEDPRVLRAAQIVLDEGLARPILIGRRDVVDARIAKLGLRLKPDVDVELVDPGDDPRYRDYWTLYHELMGRKGVSPDYAKTVVRTRTSAIGALMVRKGDADAMICGTVGQYRKHLEHLVNVIGLAPGVHDASAMTMLILESGTYFLADTHVGSHPRAEDLAEMAALSAKAVRNFYIEPKIAFLSHSNFGSSDRETAPVAREAVRLLQERYPALQVEGEMHADAALDAATRDRLFPASRLKGSANLLILPSLDAGNIAYNLLKALGGGLAVGPMLLGLDKPAHIATPSVTGRGLVNMTAIAVVEAQAAGRAPDGAARRLNAAQ